jgi:hypothetical protein
MVHAHFTNACTNLKCMHVSQMYAKACMVY